MVLLLTNDDGYGAEGIVALEKALEKEGHTVYVMAPSGNRSGMSHGMTFSSLDFKQIEKNKWTCSGKPVDCVVSALKSDIFPEKIEAVLSGINAGANIGTDVLYSGTCAAARQASMYGIPGIALSIEPAAGSSYVKDSEDGKNRYDYSGMVDFVVKNVRTLAGLCRLKSPYAFVNVNALAGKKYDSVEMNGKLAVRNYNDSIFLHEKDSEGMQRSEFRGLPPETTAEDGCDYKSVYSGKISVSVIYAEPVPCPVDCINFSL